MTGPAEIVIDDHLLIRVLLGDEPDGLRPGGARLHTTGLWYHRLCRSVADEAVVGTLSRALGPIDRATGTGVVGSIVALPPWIHVRSLRDLAWPMAEILGSGYRLDLLSLEALAAAEALGAELCLASDDDNQPLRRAAAERNTPLRLLDA